MLLCSLSNDTKINLYMPALLHLITENFIKFSKNSEVLLDILAAYNALLMNNDLNLEPYMYRAIIAIIRATCNDFGNNTSRIIIRKPSSFIVDFSPIKIQYRAVNLSFKII